MKILKTAQAYYPFQESGGPAVKIRAIALGLARRGHTVTVLTSDWGFQPSLAPSMNAEKCSWGWCAEEHGVKAIFLRAVANYHTLSLNPGVITFCRRFLRQFDVVHVYGLYDLLGPTVTFLGRKNHIPYVVEPMGMFRPIIRSIGMKKAYHRVFGQHLLTRAHRLIATSDQEKLEMINGGINSERIAVRRNGVEAPSCIPACGAFRAKWQIPPASKLVLYLGRLEPKKSPELLLEAFARWRERLQFGVQSVLVIAGPTRNKSYSAWLKSLASSKGITEAVRFTGPLYEQDKWAAYRDANVFVLPSQNENFGNSAAEAMVCGTPVIVTDQCGIAPFIDGRAGLVVKHDAAAIAGALKVLLEDETAAARFSRGCATVVEDLSWDDPISEMVKIYNEALSAAFEPASSGSGEAI
jgi:glycosyltransferase involved in cell wall biosynthesis